MIMMVYMHALGDSCMVKVVGQGYHGISSLDPVTPQQICVGMSRTNASLQLLNGQLCKPLMFVRIFGMGRLYFIVMAFLQTKHHCTVICNNPKGIHKH